MVLLTVVCSSLTTSKTFVKLPSMICPLGDLWMKLCAWCKHSNSPINTAKVCNSQFVIIVAKSLFHLFMALIYLHAVILVHNYFVFFFPSLPCRMEARTKDY